MTASTVDSIHIIGGGLAGTEAALTLARAGVSSVLFEMRPGRMTDAHRTPLLAELVCSNSLRSDSPGIAVGLLKEEMRKLGSPVLEVADRTSVPAGSALAVDREVFARELTSLASDHPLVEVRRKEVTRIPSDALTILCPGPLASDALMAHVEEVVGSDRCFFFDAIAPIVDADSLDISRLFSASRHEEGEGDYLNAPMDEDAYTRFMKALITADKIVPYGFDELDKLPLFGGCEPVEAIASRGWTSLAHGPLRPTGFGDVRRTERKLWAVVQFRAENRARSAYNLVGFQTRLTRPEQKRVFRLIPGLEKARFLRYGSLHRNSYIDSPRLAAPDLSLKDMPDVFVAGQFAGAEGYVESCASGLLAARFVLARLSGAAPAPPPPETALGGLLLHITSSQTVPLQPSNMHWGLLPPAKARRKKDRRQLQLAKARSSFDEWFSQIDT